MGSIEVNNLQCHFQFSESTSLPTKLGLGKWVGKELSGKVGKIKFIITKPETVLLDNVDFDLSKETKAEIINKKAISSLSKELIENLKKDRISRFDCLKFIEELAKVKIVKNLGFYQVLAEKEAIGFIEENDSRFDDVRLECQFMEAMGVTPYENMITALEKVANLNHSDAQQMLGSIYFTGSGVKQDYMKAHKYFQILANQNNAYALHFLGCRYHEGDSIKKDPDQAKSYWIKAAQAGSPNAISDLKRHYKIEFIEKKIDFREKK